MLVCTLVMVTAEQLEIFATRPCSAVSTASFDIPDTFFVSPVERVEPLRCGETAALRCERLGWAVHVV